MPEAACQAALPIVGNGPGPEFQCLEPARGEKLYARGFMEAHPHFATIPQVCRGRCRCPCARLNQ